MTYKVLATVLLESGSLSIDQSDGETKNQLSWPSFKLGTTSESTLKCPSPQSYIKRLIDDKVTRLNQETWLTDGPRIIWLAMQSLCGALFKLPEQ